MQSEAAWRAGAGILPHGVLPVRKEARVRKGKATKNGQIPKLGPPKKDLQQIDEPLLRRAVCASTRHGTSAGAFHVGPTATTNCHCPT